MSHTNMHSYIDLVVHLSFTSEMTPLVPEGSVPFLSHLKGRLHALVKHQKIKQNQANIFLNTNPQSPELVYFSKWADST